MKTTDIRRIKRVLYQDPILANAIKGLNALNLEACGNVYHELVKNIVYQQISYKAADSIYAKFLLLTGSEDYHPQRILEFAHEDLRSAGLSNQKANYIRNISEYFIEEKLLDFDWEKLDDDQIIALLCQIKGVGHWTAKMILIFQLGREDVFPFEDLAIQYVIQELYDLKEEKSDLKRRLIEIAELCRPFRTMASLYLWSYRRSQLEKGKTIDGN